MSKKSRQSNAGPANRASSPPPNPPSSIPLSVSLPPMHWRPLLVASLGNPGPTYANTLHSAGHVVLTALASHLGYPLFTRSRPHGAGSISQGKDALLWQSPTLMNVSGPAVASAWRQFLRDLDMDEQKRARLVVVHDDLENSLGKIKIRKGGSAKGHNGLKSCIGSLNGMDFWRIGVGIGRPTSRESRDVSAHVLRKMTRQEREDVTSEVVQFAEELGKLAWEK